MKNVVSILGQQRDYRPQNTDNGPDVYQGTVNTENVYTPDSRDNPISKP
jgi:hypothetical protein